VSEARIVSYDDEKHRESFYEITQEYFTWVHQQVLSIFNMEVFTGGDITGYLDKVFPDYRSISPPHGEVFILEVGGQVVGMCVLKELQKGVGEIKRMYVRPDYRGNGYGSFILDRLEERAREFGYKVLRLDTNKFMKAAQHVYYKRGFVERGVYPGSEWERARLRKTMSICSKLPH
jgi:GNAT superfamily N-acetyltransferase